MAHATTPASTGLDLVIAAHARQLVRVLPLAVTGDVTAVHRSRVASRRLRETLPLASAATGEHATEHLGRDLRRITRALGRVRELDVTLALLEAETRRHPEAASVCGPIERAWVRERDAGHRAMAAKLGRIDLPDLRSRLRSLGRHVAAAPRRLWTRALDSRVRQRASALATRVSGLGALYVPERLHAVRIAAKKLRYSLEVGRAAAGLRCAREIGELVAAQDLLGEWHDLFVVQTKLQSATGARRGAGARAAAALIRQCDADCRDRHARFLAMAPQLVDVCDRVRKIAASHRMLRMPSIAPAASASLAARRG